VAAAREQLAHEADDAKLLHSEDPTSLPPAPVQVEKTSQLF
jgi:hypothetical protein